MSKSDTAARAVTALERIATQASRIEVIANIVGDFLGHKSDLYQRLEQEVRVSKSIIEQAKDEATTKVEATAAATEGFAVKGNPEQTDKGETSPSDVPEYVQEFLNEIQEIFESQDMKIKIHPVPLTSISDILKKL